MSVPNVSEGRDLALIADLVAAFELAAQDWEAEATAAALAAADPDASRSVRLLDVHSDPDHHRSVFTLAGPQGSLAGTLLAGARVAIAEVDVIARARASAHATESEPAEPGQHPHVGALDVVPIVYLDAADRGAACAEALVLGDRIGGELGVPVFLYGELSGEDEDTQRTRADLRRGGIARLQERMTPKGGREPELVPDFGPHELHPTAGATLVAARPPLVAFNLQLAAPATLELARWIAARIREGGEDGLPGVRAMGVALQAGAQVSTNIERPFEVPVAEVVAAVRKHAPVAGIELVGLAPAASLEGLPDDVPFPDFDPARHVIENALRS
jgi:glutamate formiminotransferase